MVMRHIHTIDMNGHSITMVIPARVFKSNDFVPFLKQHSQSAVETAQSILRDTKGIPVKGCQKYHICKLITNHRSSVVQSSPKITCTSSATGQPAEFVDLICTMPCQIGGHHAKALIDTASNHSMVTRTFLDRHLIRYTPRQGTTTGISGSAAPSLGRVSLRTRIGRRYVDIIYTVVESLPAAAADTYRPNEALLALDALQATNIKLHFEKPHQRRPRIRIKVPPEPRYSKRASHRIAKPWYHVIHVEQNYTTESSPLDEFLISKTAMKSLIEKSQNGGDPVYVAHVRPATAQMNVACAGTKKSGYLATQVPPGHVPQDISDIPQSIKNVIDRHKEPGGTLGPPPPNTAATGFEMDIELLPGARPRAARQYRLTPREELELEKQLKHLITMGWVSPSCSPWASAVLFAPKPGGKLRLCIDYRYLNENTIKNTYPLPRIDTLLDQLSGHRYFSALDLHSGYHQIKLSESAAPKTAFRTPDGLYQWTVMPFGLTNAPSVFQRAMHVVLQGLIGKICLAYLDDIVVLGKTQQEHARNLDLVLSRLAQHNFFCNLDKCQFAMQEIKYLGHIVTADTVKPDPYKVEVLQNWPVEDIKQSPNQIRSFLGLAGYFRRFIPKFPTLAAPLLQHVNSKEPLPWSEQCVQPF